MAADETFSNVKALQEATAKDVQQRIATAHLRPVPSSAVLSRPLGIHPTPGEAWCESAYAAAPHPIPTLLMTAQPAP